MGYNYPALVELVMDCLHSAPDRRPTADDLVVRLQKIKEKLNEEFNGGDVIKQLKANKLKQQKVCIHEYKNIA